MANFLDFLHSDIYATIKSSITSYLSDYKEIFVLDENDSSEIIDRTYFEKVSNLERELVFQFNGDSLQKTSHDVLCLLDILDKIFNRIFCVPTLLAKSGDHKFVEVSLSDAGGSIVVESHVEIKQPYVGKVYVKLSRLVDVILNYKKDTKGIILPSSATSNWPVVIPMANRNDVIQYANKVAKHLHGVATSGKEDYQKVFDMYVANGCPLLVEVGLKDIEKETYHVFSRLDLLHKTMNLNETFDFSNVDELSKEAYIKLDKFLNEKNEIIDKICLCDECTKHYNYDDEHYYLLQPFDANKKDCHCITCNGDAKTYYLIKKG